MTRISTRWDLLGWSADSRGCDRVRGALQAKGYEMKLVRRRVQQAPGFVEDDFDPNLVQVNISLRRERDNERK